MNTIRDMLLRRNDEDHLAGRGLLQKADAARDMEQWRFASQLYAEFVNRSPGSHEIWVQLGNCLKESGDMDGAEAAYRKALEINPDVADTNLQLGHLLKITGRLADAHAAYTTAVQLDGASDAHHELASLSQFYGKPLIAAAGASVRLVFDCSDLFEYLKDNRLPTGIQRVQINLVKGVASAATPATQFSIIFFTRESLLWHSISIVDFHMLVNAAQSNIAINDRDWTDLRDRMYNKLKQTRYNFVEKDILVNLGTSWWIVDYFHMIRTLKQSHSIYYIPFIHDCIPLITPEYCSHGLVKEFETWLRAVFIHSDAYLVNSKSTAKDLKRIAHQYGHEISEPVVLPLDGDMRSGAPENQNPGGNVDLTTLFRKQGVPVDCRFVLMVSTLEARKNHILALRIWDRLLTEHGDAFTPLLICVGKPGWRFQEADDFMLARKRLSTRVRFMSDLSDAILEKLFEACMFTIYPSHYEGWGLPVTESLCFGKIPLVARNSSLPEAGGDFAEYFEPGVLSDAFEKTVRLIFDAAYRDERQRKIKAGFRPRQWVEIARGLLDGISAFRLPDSISTVSGIPALQLGAIYSMSSCNETASKGQRVDGESARSGRGWHRCENWGVWTAAGEARLVFQPTAVPLRNCILYLGLRGHRGRDVVVTLSCSEKRQDRVFEIPDSSDREVALQLGDLPVTGQPLSFALASDDVVDLGLHTGGADRRIIGVGLRWLALCERSDVAGRLNVIEATAFAEARPLD